MKAFYDNCIEDENPGILLLGVTIEDMKHWGSGVRRIFSEALKIDFTEPQIEETGMHIRFTVGVKERGGGWFERGV